MEGEIADAGTAAPRRARRWVPFVVLSVVILAVVGGVFVKTRRSAEDLSCSHIDVRMESAPPSAPIDRADVLLYERSGNGLSGWEGIDVVIARDGSVVALDEWTGPAPTYVTARLAPDTVQALRTCIESEGLRRLQPKELTGASGRNEKGSFCAVADASTVLFAAGPAANAGTKFSVYGPGMAGCLHHPQVVTDLNAALSEVMRQSRASGAPTSAPSEALAPA